MMWYFIALCFLAVKAQNNTDTKTSLTVKGSEAIKVEATNVSALYIGDLLRTKPKEILEVAGSAHAPVVLDQSFLPSASLPDLSLYRSHGGHEYAESEYAPLAPESRSNVPNTVKRFGEQAKSFPVNVRGHLLTLKPVRVVTADNVPVSRNAERHHTKSSHYPNDDCSKSSERSYSSEEKPHATEQQTYPRAKHIASNSELEYRSPPSRYSEDDSSETYSSHSDPSTGRYRSETYPSDTNSKSHSSGSYTKSKSSSTSKTVNSNKSKKPYVVPSAVSNKENYEKRPESPHDNQEYAVYKTRESPNQRPSSYSDNSEREYAHSNYGRESEPAVREPHYSPEFSGVRKSKKYTHERPTQYSPSEPKDRPQQYGQTHYEQDQGSYDQSSYAPEDGQRYSQQNKPSSNYNENDYNQRQVTKPEYKPYQNYQTPEGAPYGTQPSEAPQSKKHRNTQYDRTSNEGKEHRGYRAREHSEYSYNPEHQVQSSRGRKGSSQNAYDSNSPRDTHAEHVPYSHSYDRPQSSIRPTEKQFRQYSHESTPVQTNIRPASHTAHKRLHRESSRPVRSPARREKSLIAEGRAQLPVAGNEQVVMISKESIPYVSRSESHSESSYNMGNTGSPKLKDNVEKQRHIQRTERRQNINPEYQTSYKPYNSEYPASYANDQHHNEAKQHRSRTYEKTYEQPHSYDGPVHSQTHSHSGEAPQQHHPYHKEQEYDDDEDSSDQGRPMKKDKNHHYISKVEGYKDTYANDEPLTIDEEFFKKYGISPTAKVIVANAENPNLFVADGTQVKEGEFFGNSGPHSGSVPHSGANYGPNSGESEEQKYEPNYNSDYREDTYSDSPEEQGPPKQIPSSFDDLVDTNPKFLRNLPQLMKGDDGFFKMDSTEDSFDGVQFPKVGEHKGYIVSQGPREIVQQHGDGVSRIIFNVPKSDSDSDTTNVPTYKEQNEERIVEAASKLIENIIKSNS